MKFAREFKAALGSGDYPEDWCTAAIPYPALKKCLNKIRAELQDLGLDAESLKQLLAAEAVSPLGDHVPLAKYKLDVSDSYVHPHFTILVDFEDGTAVDATLSPASKAFLARQAALQRQSIADDEDRRAVENGAAPETAAATLPGGPDSASAAAPPASPLEAQLEALALAPAAAAAGEKRRNMRRVEVSLSADSEFFRVIYEDMAKIERIGQREQASIVADVAALGEEVAAVARPERRRRSLLGVRHAPAATATAQKRSGAPGKYATDLSRWRELFELYLDAQVFFSTRERDHGKARTAAQASRQLDWFQEQVRQRGLLARFQLPGSVAAYQRFLLLNKRLFLNLRFRELNQTARVKILKKFDKWTSLGVSQAFPHALSRRHHDVLVESMAKDVCARIAADVVAVVPRLEDYTCPVCLSLAWLPVRLRCRHVFCVRCVIKMQRDAQKLCPLCRDEVVMEADLDSLDADLERFLKLYFRAEAKEKQKANELERGVELFGESYKPTSCVLM